MSDLKTHIYLSLGLDPSLVTHHRDGTISYDGNVDWTNRPFTVLPLKFRKVSGHFSCRRCTSLISLEGAPQEVRGDFSCRGCTSLVSLNGAPQEVGGHFSCRRCTSLVSLEGAPQEVRSFSCINCSSLRSLKGGPRKVRRLDLEGTSIYVIPEDMVITSVWLDGPNDLAPTEEAREILKEFKSSIKSDEDAGEVLLDRMNRPRWQVAYASDYLNKDIQK